MKKLICLLLLTGAMMMNASAQRKVALKPKEDIIEFIFAKTQKYNAHPGEYKRNVDTISFNGKVKAELNIFEIDTILVTKTNVTIYSKLGIQKFNHIQKKMMNYPDLQLSLDAHDWDFYEENLYARLTKASTDYIKALHDEQTSKRKAGHDPTDAY